MMEILGLPVFSAQPAENVGSFAAFPTLSPSMSRSHTDFDANIIRFISFDDPAQEAIDSQICINAGGPNLSYDQGSPSANDWVDVIQTITRAKEGIEDIGLVESETGSTERCRLVLRFEEMLTCVESVGFVHSFKETTPTVAKVERVVFHAGNGSGRYCFKS